MGSPGARLHRHDFRNLQICVTDCITQDVNQMITCHATHDAIRMHGATWCSCRLLNHACSFHASCLMLQTDEDTSTANLSRASKVSHLNAGTCRPALHGLRMAPAPAWLSDLGLGGAGWSVAQIDLCRSVGGVGHCGCHPGCDPCWHVPTMCGHLHVRHIAGVSAGIQ